MTVALAAYLFVAGSLVLAAFQAAIALGAPVGRAAWGGRHPGRLPTGFRVASAVAIAIYLLVALIVLDRAGVPLIDLPDQLARWGTWAIVVLLAIGTVMNLASASPYERYGWAPLAALMAILALFVALS